MPPAGGIGTLHCGKTQVGGICLLQVAELELRAEEASDLRKRVLSAEAARDAAAEESVRATSMLNNLEARLSEVRAGLRALCMQR